MAHSQVSEMPGVSYMVYDPSDDEEIHTFESMRLREKLLRGISASGLKKPSSIQQRGILPIVSGRDVIAQAHSRTNGKTETFVISLLQSLDTSLRETQALVLTHTRESAKKIQKVVRAFGYYMDVQCHACIGGTRRSDDKRTMDCGQHVVCGTPGRVYDIIRRRVLRTSNIKMIIVDEADEMLSKGFKEHIEDVFRYLPQTIQVVIFSATVTDDYNKFMTGPLKILEKREAVVNEEGIFQVHCTECGLPITQCHTRILPSL